MAPRTIQSLASLDSSSLPGVGSSSHKVVSGPRIAAQAHDRDRVLALVSSPSGDGGSDRPDSSDPPDPPADSSASLPARTGYRIRWAKLLARVFGTQVLVCPDCGGARTIIAAITERVVVTTLLTCLGLPTDASELTPARAPPQPELFVDRTIT